MTDHPSTREAPCGCSCHMNYPGCPDCNFCRADHQPSALPGVREPAEPTGWVDVKCRQCGVGNSVPASDAARGHMGACGYCGADLPVYLDYPAAARSIALWLKDYCDESLPFPTMIADAVRKAAAALSTAHATAERTRELLAECVEWLPVPSEADDEFNTNLRQLRQRIKEATR